VHNPTTDDQSCSTSSGDHGNLVRAFQTTGHSGTNEPMKQEETTNVGTESCQNATCTFCARL